MRKNGGEKQTERGIGQLLRGILLAALSSVGLALVLAVLVLLTDMEDKWITGLDQVIKALSILLGASVACKNRKKKGVRGLLCGLGYMLLGILLYSSFAGKILPAKVMGGEVLFGCTVGILSGLLLAVRANGS